MPVKTIIKIAAPLLCLILLFLPCRFRSIQFFRPVPPEDTVRCELLMDRSVYRKSNPIGFHYDMISRYGDWAGVPVHIAPGDSSTWKRMHEREIDLVICSPDQEIPEDIASTCIFYRTQPPIMEITVLKDDDYRLFSSISHWFRIFSNGSEFHGLKNKYYSNYQNRRMSLGTISPYDEIIKKYSREYGWDWKMIAAIIQKESKFFIGAESHRGAIGLMQIKQSTADHYGITNLFDPENNIKAGIMYLSSIAKRMRTQGIPEEEIFNFTLAAFNAGEGRIEDCRNFTRSQHRNPNSWAEIVAVIPLMREEEHYTGEHIRLGKFKGDETIAYVEEVQNIYRKYKALP